MKLPERIIRRNIRLGLKVVKLGLHRIYAVLSQIICGELSFRRNNYAYYVTFYVSMLLCPECFARAFFIAPERKLIISS